MGKVLELHAVGRQYDPYLTPGCVCPVVWPRMVNKAATYKCLTAVPKHVMLYCTWMFCHQLTNSSNLLDGQLCRNIATI